MGEMSTLLFGFLILHLSTCASSKQPGLEENVGGDPKEKMCKREKLNGIEEKVEDLLQRMEIMDTRWKLEKALLEEKLDIKNVEVEDLQKQLKEAKRKNENQEVAKSLRSEMENQCKAEVKKELEKVLPSAVEQGLRDLPFEMVCAYQDEWTESNSIVAYDRISVEFNNNDRPGGADGTMNIDTGVFTTVTSGYYIVTFSGFTDVHVEETTSMYLYHNGVQVEESLFQTRMGVGGSGNYMFDQGSRTVILHLLAGDTLDLRTEYNSYRVLSITLCLNMAP